jgi:hypothetical protein
MMKKFLLNLGMILMMSSCILPSKFMVTRVGEEPQTYKQRYIYSLPRTVVWVKIDYEKENYVPGPYRMFSQKYLGISDIIDKSETRWKIVDTELSSYNEPDPGHYYSLNMIRGSVQSVPFLQFSQEGLILNPDKDIKLGSSVPLDENIKSPYFTDLSEEEYFVESPDTLFKTIIQDTTFITVPILRKQRDAKTLEQKAEEAANFIIQIRKRRFKLEAGDYDVFPEGRALETAVRELNKLEKEYISLFVGRIYTQKYSRSYFITPSGTPENITFLKFSGDKGILPADSNEGESVTVEFDPLGNTELLKENLPQAPEEDHFNVLYYRLPEVTSVRLVKKEKLLYESRLTVYQSGSLVSIPLWLNKIKNTPWKRES